jgi:hypothetical protein
VRRVVVAALATVLVAGACSGGPDNSDDSGTTRTGEPIAWTQVQLPAGDEAVALTPDGDQLLVGLRHPGARPVPRLMVRSADGRLTPVPLQPKSPYAYEATWLSLVTDGGWILAIGGAPGGAHSNTRWTVWTGSTKGLVEKPQSFNTFGGWGAGNLLDAVATPAGTALVGSWGSDKAGLDAAVWLPSGERWVRRPSAGTALESTSKLLVSARSATAAGDGLVLPGSQVTLGDGFVKQQAAVWRSTSLNQGWTRVELPEPGDRSEAIRARCTADDCLMSGYADGELALWRLDGGTASRLPGLPPVAVGDKDDVPAPIDVDGTVLQIVGDNGKVKVLTGKDDQWTVHESTGPSGPVVDALRLNNTLYLITATTLWTAEVP